MKSFFPDIRGNESLRRRIGAEFYEGAFSHAYILEGGRGFGKHMLARQIAMAAACENRKSSTHPLPCGICKHCRKIAADNCVDVITVAKPEGRATMSVDTVRALREGIATVPNDLDVKVYIIEDAHTMTKQAQNALLLTLEEPPAFVLFLLLTEDAGALLETVRSRAPIFRLQPLDRDTMQSYLITAPAGIAGGAPALLREHPEEFEALLTLSAGSVGQALTLLDPQKRAPLLQQRQDAEEILRLLATHAGQDELFLLLRSLGTARDELSARLTTLLLALRDLTLLSRTEHAPLLFFTNREQAIDLAASFTTARLLLISRTVEEAKEALAANANVRLTLTQLQTQLFTT
ncbi:MAG: hypothetical protein IKB41_00645 [Clostridia bacterium]|nr:hypothetical protein [Clostridia bacterium]